MARALPFGAAAVALVLPWTTWLRLSAPTADAALSATPLLLFTLAALAIIAALIAPSDPWLAGFVVYAAVMVLRSTDYALEVAQWVAFGALFLHAARRIREPRPVVRALLAVGLAETVYLGLQTWRLDPIFAGWGWTVREWPAGTLGNPDWIAAFLALLVPIASWPVAVALFGGLVLTKSTLGIVAALIGVAVRWRTVWTLWAVLVGAALAPLVRNVPLLTAAEVRRDILLLGLGEWWAAGWPARVLGVGPGEWWARIPAAQVRRKVYPFEFFTWAHSDVAQLLFEFGVVGLLLLAGWCWWHRAMFRGPYGGALAALAVLSAAFFPFHLACIAAVALLLVALATTREACAV